MADNPIKKFGGMVDDALSKAKQARAEQERRQLLSTVGQDIAKMLAPVLAQIAQSATANKLDVRTLAHELMGQVNAREMNIDTKPITDAIEQALLGIQLPEPKVTVNVPPVEMPKIEFPKEMDVRGFVSLMGVSLETPLPVQIRNADGSPFNPMAGMTNILAGGGGGKRDFLTIKGFSQSAFAELMNPDNRLKVELPTGSSGLTDSELRATAVPVSQVSGANWSVSVAGATGTLATNIVDGTGIPYDGGNPVPVAIISGSIGGTQYPDDGNAEPGTGGLMIARDSNGTTMALRVGSGTSERALRVIQAADSVSSVAGTVVVSGVTASIAANIVDSSGVAYTTTNPVPVGDAGGSLTIDGTVTVSDVTASLKSALVDSSGVQYSGSNPLPVNVVSQSLASSASALVDSSGVQYSGSNPVPVTVGGGTATIFTVPVNVAGLEYDNDNPLPVILVSGQTSSTVAVGDVASDVADPSSNPVKIGGIARTANPTAVAAGDRVSFTADDLGRQVVRNVQVRDLVKTAYVSVTGGTETTLLAAVAGSFLDLIMIVASNNSDAAVSVDIRAVTAGNVVNTLRIPANGTAGWTPPVPWPQDATGNNWTVDGPDETGRTLTFSALFSQEV